MIGFDDQIKLGHLLLQDRKCRVCGQTKNLIDGYYRTRKKCEEISEFLRKNGLKSSLYHSWINISQKNILIITIFIFLAKKGLL